MNSDASANRRRIPPSAGIHVRATALLRPAERHDRRGHHRGAREHPREELCSHGLRRMRERRGATRRGRARVVSQGTSSTPRRCNTSAHAPAGTGSPARACANTFRRAGACACASRVPNRSPKPNRVHVSSSNTSGSADPWTTTAALGSPSVSPYARKRRRGSGGAAVPGVGWSSCRGSRSRCRAPCAAWCTRVCAAEPVHQRRAAPMFRK